MKKLIPFLSLLFLAGMLSAQIVVTDATFPAVGDTLKTATDLAPSGIEITGGNGPHDWDFSSLSIGVMSETVYQDASDGMVSDELPTATHLVIDGTTGGEAYFRITAEKMELLGANGDDPTGLGVNALFKFSPPLMQRRAPLEFPSTHESDASIKVAMDWDELPQEVRDLIPLPLVDSIRLNVQINVDDFVDAYGTLTIPGGTYEVLRQEITETRESLVEAKAFGGWSDVTGLIPAPFNEFLKDTSYSYDFYSATEKEIIASVSVDAEDNPISVTFKDNGGLTNDDEVTSGLPTVSIMPNPVSTWANFEFQHFPKGDYFMNISALNGKQVLNQTLLLDNYRMTSINLSDLPTANYFYLLKNEEGKIISSGKLMKQ